MPRSICSCWVVYLDLGEIRLIKGVYNLRLAVAFLFQTIKGPLRKKKVKKCSIREIYHSLQCQAYPGLLPNWD